MYLFLFYYNKHIRSEISLFFGTEEFNTSLSVYADRTELLSF